MDENGEKASVTRPWTKYYREKPLRDFNVHQTLWNLLYQANQNNMSYRAINFMGFRGNEWTYRELFDKANQLASAYKKIGVTSQDTVLILTVSGVEEALNLLALNKIGVVSKWMDITASEKEMEFAINSDNCKYVVCFAAAITNLCKIIHRTKVKKVFYVEPGQFIRPLNILLHGLKGVKKLAQLTKQEKLPKMPKDSVFIRFDEFMNSGDKKFKFEASYIQNEPVLKIQSSGTTGTPKIIVHTNYSINCSIRKFSGTDLPLYPQKVLLKTAPAWVGYGLINTLATGLAYGMEVMMTPSVSKDALYRYNQMYDVVFAVPFHYRYMADHITELKSMNRPIALISGGDKISKNEIENFQRIFGEKGCKAPILNGAGSNEILGAGYVNPLNANRPGSVGIPMWKDIVSIFDPETLEEKSIGERGEICCQTEAAFLCYDKNKEQTKKVKKVHSDGKVWIHTNDLGYQDKDGYIYIEGRLTRVITVGGFKISANLIEDIIQEDDCVKECVVVAIPDAEKGEIPMAFIVLKSGTQIQESDIVQEIKKRCHMHLKEKAVPKYYYVLDSIPYTSNNKQDYKKLEKIGEKYIQSQSNIKI